MKPNSVLVIGSGPIVIGQAAEFDYSGTQACRVLKDEGIKTVLINSNPATIMTDPDVADHIYIEPLDVEHITEIIKKEQIDAVLGGVGGQTGLNLLVELHDLGILDEYNIQVLGTDVDAIKRGEDRDLFRELMIELNIPIVESRTVTSIEGGLAFAEHYGYPVVVRPAYTLGGTGGGIAENEEEFLEILQLGLTMSRVGQVLLERSIKGWKEIEFEVMRDKDGNAITVCSMENVDPVGVHTGDSIVVAPVQTLTDIEVQMLRTVSLDIINEIGVVGGCNVQLALNPISKDFIVIEINPRVSRSSALASKATGYPIAKVSTKLALGYRLDEITNDVTKETLACFEPALDYCVVKIPKWPFDKFRRAKRFLGTKMMATGEVMAIANSFEAALLKAVRSLEIKKNHLITESLADKTDLELIKRIKVPDDERLFDIAECIRRGITLERLNKETAIDLFFLRKIERIVSYEKMIETKTMDTVTDQEFIMVTELGMSKEYLSKVLGTDLETILLKEKELGYQTSYQMVDTCAGEFDAKTPYYYSAQGTENETIKTKKDSVMVIGSGPIRIGQGIEFDYASVHAVNTLKANGYESIMVNNNPETVSTDFDTSDKLYFEALTFEDIYQIYLEEQPKGVILQFGGQTAIGLAEKLHAYQVPVLGTDYPVIDLCEDRNAFDALLEKHDIKRPKGIILKEEKDLALLETLNFPILARPSYVLGGHGMEVIQDMKHVMSYLREHPYSTSEQIWFDEYIEGIEIEVDCITDGEIVVLPGIMEHLDKSGIHSGDSISVYPPVHLSNKVIDDVVSITTSITTELDTIGIVNIQMIVKEESVYVIEVNPRASRTVPYLSKVTKIPMVELAVNAMLGTSLTAQGYQAGLQPVNDMYAVKVPVFSTHKLPGVELSLGPEMRSTGEVLGVGHSYEEALAKGMLAAGIQLLKPDSNILLTVNPSDKKQLEQEMNLLKQFPFSFFATEGTGTLLKKHGISVTIVDKISDGIPNIIDTVRSGMLDMIINTPTKANDAKREGFRIRRASVEAQVPLITSLDTFIGLLKILEKQINPYHVYDMNFDMK